MFKRFSSLATSPRLRSTGRQRLWRTSLLLIAALALLSASTLSFSMNIFEAIRKRNIERVRELVEVDKIDVNNITDDNGWTPFYFACISGNLAIVQLILSKCTDYTVNKVDNCGNTALDRACFYENLAIVKLIFPRCTDDTINKVDKFGATSLSEACRYGNIAIVRLLLPRCTVATINKADKFGETLLFWACNHRVNLVRLLLEYGANVDQESLRKAQYNQNDLPNGPEILRLINLAQDLDNSESMFKFIDNQTNADQEFLRERLWKKHGIKVERKERTRVKRLLEEDERVPMDSVCCVNGTTRIFNCIA